MRGHALGKSSRSSSCATVAVRAEAEQFGHRHVEPLAVVAHLQSPGIGVEDVEGLVLVGAGVAADLLG